jgi:sugar lactone lactonase YvrE
MTPWKPCPYLAFTPDGKTLAASDEGGARLWDVATGRELRRIRGVKGWVRSLSFAPDGKTLAGITDRGVSLWEVATGRERTGAPHREGRLLVFAPKANLLATAIGAGAVTLWDGETRREVGWFHLEHQPHPDLNFIRSLALTPDGKTLAAGSDDGIVRLWDRATGQLRRRLAGHIDGVNAIAIAPDGKTLASASDDGTTLLWDLTWTGID